MLKTALSLLTALLLTWGAPAQSSVIASYTSGMGLLCTGCPQPDPTTQYTAVSIFGTSIYSAPVANGDTVVIDLAGSPLAAVAAWFTDGVDTSSPAWIALEIGYAPTFTIISLSEHPSLIGDLAGNTIAGVRVTLDQFCFDVRDGENLCNNDPNGVQIGYTARYTLQFFDAAVNVSEPTSAALCAAALLGLAAAGRRQRRLVHSPR